MASNNPHRSDSQRNDRGLKWPPGILRYFYVVISRCIFLAHLGNAGHVTGNDPFQSNTTVNRGRPTHLGGRGRHRSRGKSTRSTESDQYHRDFSAKVDSTQFSMSTMFSSDSNFSSSHSQNKGRGGQLRGQGRGRLKSTAHAKLHNTVGELCVHLCTISFK